MLEAIPIVFTELYDFNSGENGLMFMGQIIGPTVGMGKCHLVHSNLNISTQFVPNSFKLLVR